MRKTQEISGFSELLPLTANGSLSSGEAGDRDAERRAGHIVQTDLVAELDGCRVAAVLAADTYVELRVDGLAELDGHIHELAYAGLVELCERIVLKDLGVIVSGEELARVVTAEAEGHLGEVVGAEAEEVGLSGDLVSCKSSARDLDHSTDFVLEVGAGGGDLSVSGLYDELLDVLELLGIADKRDHDLGNDVPVGMSLLDVDSGADDSLGLHLGDLGIGDGQTAAAVTHHRVELVERIDDSLDLGNGLALSLGQSLDVGFLGGNELVERRVKETDGNGVAFESFIELLKVALLIRQDLLESYFALFESIGADHLAESGDTVAFEEHVLGTAEADALGAQLAGLLGVGGSIGVGADLESSVLVSPSHDAAELAGDLSVNGGDDTVIDVTGGAVDGDEVAFDKGLAGEGELLVSLVHNDLGAAGYAAGTHAAGNNGSVRGHTAANGQDALSGLHAFDIFGRSLKTDENYLLASAALSLGVLSGEYDLAAGSAGRSAETLAHGGSGLERLSVELRMEQCVEVTGIDHQNGLFLGSHALVNEVAGDLESSLSCTLAVTGLEHIELAVLDGELHVLHISVVIFKDLANLVELSEGLGELLLHLGDVHGGTNAGNDVFALGVGKELAEEALVAGGGVAGERNAGTAVIAHVAERHRLDVNGCAPAVGDIVVTSVDVGSGVVPGTENGLDSAHELFLGIGREVLTDLGLILGLELLRELLEVVGGQLNVLLNAAVGLHLVDEFLKVLLADFHNDVGVHLDKSSVAVISPAGVATLYGDGLDNLFVKTEVEDGVHHTGHGSAGAGTDGYEKRVLLVAELLAGDLFHLADILVDLSLDLVVDLTAVLIILGAGLGGDGEALGNGQTDVGHLGEVGAFAAEKFSHVSVTFCKKVHKLLAHWNLLLKYVIVSAIRGLVRVLARA